MAGKKHLLTLAAFGMLSLTSLAHAVVSVPYGWYIDANAGSTHLSNVNYPGSSSSSGLGGNVDVGYKFMPYFGAELGYTLYANSSIKTGAGTKAATVKHYSYDAAAKGILPISCSGFELFAKVGIDRVVSSNSISNAAAASSIGISSGSHSATGLYLAAGASYFFIPEMAIVVQWARAQGNSSSGNLDLLSGGLTFIID